MRRERKGGWKKKGVNAPDFLFLFLSLSPFFRTTAVSLRKGKLGGERPDKSLKPKMDEVVEKERGKNPCNPPPALDFCQEMGGKNVSVIVLPAISVMCCWVVLVREQKRGERGGWRRGRRKHAAAERKKEEDEREGERERVAKLA